MRNLKRALSLALASVMLLGMMVVGTGAASYTDVDSNDNVEAIEVLNAVEVMIGRQGNFEPDEAVNRHEMAVIMAKLYLGVEAADNYVGSHPFTDVVSWADKYVAACYENGLVAGTSATTYGGGSPLTAVQAAAMMLRALGYENLSKGAANWSTPVTAKANEIRLFAGVASSPKEKLTRNQVAQLALNTLQSTMVTAKGGNDIQIGDVTIPDEMEYTVRIAEKTSVGTAIDTKYNTGVAATGAQGYTLELGEHLYNGDLRKAETTDDFGRPATRWTYKTNEVGVYVDSSSVYKSWTAKVAKNELYDLLGGGNVGRLTLKSSDLASGDKDKLVVYVDGEVKTDKAVKEYIDRDNTGASGGCAGKGVLTEVFQDNNNNVTLSFTNTYLMQATADYNETSKSVRVTVLTSPKNQTVGVNVLKSEDFSGLEGIKEDDYILYTYAKGDIQSGQVATVVTGEVTAFSKATKTDGSKKDFGDAGGSVTLDSTKRDYAKYAETDNKNGCAVEYKLGANASVVLDAYDYVIYVDDSSLSVGNYVYVNAIAPQSGLANKFLADAFFTDGTRDSIVVKEMKASSTGANLLSSSIITRVDAITAVPGSSMPVGGWYAYSKNSSGEYTLVKAANTKAFRTSGPASATDKSLTIENNKVNIGTGTGVTGVAGDKNTIFVVWGKNNKVTVYTGVANVPDVTQANGYTSWYLPSKDTSGKNASAVFIDATNGSVRNGNSDLLYLLNLDGSEKNKNNVTEDIVYTWNVVMVKDGVVEKTQIKTTDGNWAKQIAYKSYGIDSNDFYDLNNTTDKLTHTYPTGDDVCVENIPAAEIDCDGETFTWGSNSYIVNADSVKATALVVYPNKDKNASNAALLRSEVNMDEDAAYKVYTGWSGKQIANLFRDWKATGAIYAVLDAKTDKVKSMIVVVDGISTTGGTTPPAGPGDLPTPEGTPMPSAKKADAISEELAKDGVNSVQLMGNKTLKTGSADAEDTMIVIPAGKTLYVNGKLDAKDGTVFFTDNTSKLVVSDKLTLGAGNKDVKGQVSAKELELKDDTTIKAGASVTTTGNIDGTADKDLTVEEGATLTAGGTIDGKDATTSVLTVNGHLDAGTNEIKGYKKVGVYFDKTLIAGKITVGELEIGKAATATDAAKTGRVQVSGAITVTGALTVNKGVIEPAETANVASVAVSANTVAIATGTEIKANSITAQTNVTIGAGAAVTASTVTATRGGVTIAEGASVKAETVTAGTTVTVTGGTLEADTVTASGGIKIEAGESGEMPSVDIKETDSKIEVDETVKDNVTVGSEASITTGTGADAKTTYGTLKELLEGITADGGTIELLDNATAELKEEENVKGNVTIKTNGKTMSLTKVKVASDKTLTIDALSATSVLSVNKGKVAITGALDGTVTAKFTSESEYATVALNGAQTMPVTVTKDGKWDSGVAATKAALKILDNGGMFMVPKGEQPSDNAQWLAGADLYGFIYERPEGTAATRLTITKGSTVVYQNTYGREKAGKSGRFMTFDDLTGLVNALNYYEKATGQGTVPDEAKLSASQEIYVGDVGGTCYAADALDAGDYTWKVETVTLGTPTSTTVSTPSNYNLANENDTGAYKSVTVTAGTTFASGSFTLE